MRRLVKVALVRCLTILALCMPVVAVAGAVYGAGDGGDHRDHGALERPRLVVILMVDQLRGDLPLRYAPVFGEGGFRYLMDEGIWYTAARQPHSHTETAVGHTTVSTGAYPAAHGIIGNSWYRPEPPTPSAGTTATSTTAPQTPGSADGSRSTAAVRQRLAMGAHPTGHGGMEPGWLARAEARWQATRGARPGDAGPPPEAQDETATAGDDSEGDDTYKVIGTDTPGAAPVDILTTTFGDELKVATAQGAKVFAVSVKDRAAVALGGHAGKAFWFDSSTGQFVTSTYYYSAAPEWVDEWNGAGHADRYSGESWRLSRPRSDYLYGEQDDRPWEPELFGYGRVFPHPFGEPGDDGQSQALFYTKLTVSPVGDELTLSFARALIENEGLGDDDVTDLLGISLSSNDIIGHWYGPSSLESEVSIRTLDRHLAELFAELDRLVGLEHTVIVLAGDHGIPEVPEYLETLHVPTGRITDDDIESLGKETLAERYPDGDQLVAAYEHPYFYLDQARLRAAGLVKADVERYLADRLRDSPALLFAVPLTDLARGGEEFGEEMITRIRRNQNPGRSGDVYVVQASQWQVGDKPASDEPVVIVNHGSPWAYDTYVPIAFAGRSMGARVVDRPVLTTDIAPTLSLLTGAKPPSGAEGSPLSEVVGGFAPRPPAPGTEGEEP